MKKILFNGNFQLSFKKMTRFFALPIFYYTVAATPVPTETLKSIKGKIVHLCVTVVPT